MKHFQEILVTLGANDVKLLEETGDWDFWRAEYRTPINIVHGYYLYLKHKCPLKESTRENLLKWSRLSNKEGYELIVTPRSPLAQNLPSTKKAFGAKNIRTPKQLLLDNFLKDLTWKPINVEEYFIDPDVALEDSRTEHAATEFIKSWMLGTVNTSKSTTIYTYCSWWCW